LTLTDGAGSRSRIAVRPEAVTLVRRTAEPKNGAIIGKVRKATYLGSHMEYAVETPLGELFAVSRDIGESFHPGDEVEVSFESQAALPP
jgi:iron(III) transport system ATP-binding protein